DAGTGCCTASLRLVAALAAGAAALLVLPRADLARVSFLLAAVLVGAVAFLLFTAGVVVLDSLVGSLLSCGAVDLLVNGWVMVVLLPAFCVLPLRGLAASRPCIFRTSQAGFDQQVGGHGQRQGHDAVQNAVHQYGGKHLVGRQGP